MFLSVQSFHQTSAHKHRLHQLSHLVIACRYHLKDVIVGKIYFLLVRIKIKHMEIDIIKRETTGTGPNVYHENDTIAKYEIMDGAPVRGEEEEAVCELCTVRRSLNLLLFFCRRVHPHQTVSGRLRDDTHHEGHQQEVLGALLPEPGSHRRGGETILQAAGTCVEVWWSVVAGPSEACDC